MELTYLLKGLNYPCTIDWYNEFIDESNCFAVKKYEYSEMLDTINNFKFIHYVYEFKKTSPTHYKIAID